ncbi:MAG: carboxypeptidase-like regulatory domain-containing protein [Maribacter sp.]
MKKVSILFALLVFGVKFTHSRPVEPDLKNGSVSGKFMDKISQQPIPYPVIVLKPSNDSQVVTGGIMEEDCFFELKHLEEGSYKFKVQFIGYKIYSRQIIISKERTKA